MEDFTFGYWVRRQRMALDLTQAALARRVGCVKSTIKKIERSERRPSRTMAERLAESLEIPDAARETFILCGLGEAPVSRLPAPSGSAFAVPHLAVSRPQDQGQRVDTSEKPLLWTVAPRPEHNLPIQTTPFIGRERDIRRVTGLLAEHPLVTLTGPGGVGKSRLSLQAAEEMLDTFPDGVWLVELAALSDPAMVPQAVARSLGLHIEGGRSHQDTLVNFLRPRQMLLVLDNCEHLVEACAILTDHLLRACPNLKLLATSRERLGTNGEATHDVPPLRTPNPDHLPDLEEFKTYEAVRLFAERARLAEPSFRIGMRNMPAVAQICRRLDGIPLALELAAARLKMLTTAQLAERLDEAFSVLTGGSRTALPRHQTLQAAIDWSYQLLNEKERALLRRLSVFAGGFSLDGVERVCAGGGIETREIFDLLASLVDKSIVIAERQPGQEVRYRTLETVRQFARDKLLDSGEREAAQERHLEAFLRLAQEAEPHLRANGQVEWLDRLELELDNLRSALGWALENDPVNGLRLATALFWLWYIRGHRIEGERWLRQMRKLFGQETIDAHPSLFVEAQVRQAKLLSMIGQPGLQAANLAWEALEAAKNLGECGKRLRVMAMEVLDRNAANLGAKADRSTHNLERLRISEELNDKFYIAQSIAGLSFLEPDPYKAQRYTERNLTLRREIGDLEGLADAQRLMATYRFRAGEFVPAQKMYEEAIQTALLVKSSEALMDGLNMLGRLFFEQGETDKAIETFHQGLAFVQDLGDQAWIVSQYNALGHSYGQKGDFHRTKDYFQQAIDLSRSNQFVRWEAFSCLNMAEAAWSLGYTELAIQQYQNAVEVGRNLDDLPLRGVAAYASGKVALLDGDPATAHVFFQVALETYTGNGNEAGHCFESLAACAAQAGNLERAARLNGIYASRRWLKDPIGMPWLLSYNLDELLAPVREELGEARYTQLFEAGKAMPLDEAVALALEVQVE